MTNGLSIVAVTCLMLTYFNPIVVPPFRGKKIEAEALMKNVFFFFSTNIARNIYKPIFIWIVDEVAISGYFNLQGHKNLLVQNHTKLTLC